MKKKSLKKKTKKKKMSTSSCWYTNTSIPDRKFVRVELLTNPPSNFVVDPICVVLTNEHFQNDDTNKNAKGMSTMF